MREAHILNRADSGWFVYEEILGREAYLATVGGASRVRGVGPHVVQGSRA